MSEDRPAPPADASWIKDGDAWAILVPPGMAKAGQKVQIARADGTHVREVIVQDVTEREWKGMIVCTVA